MLLVLVLVEKIEMQWWWSWMHMRGGAALGRTIEVCCWWWCRREFNGNLVEYFTSLQAKLHLDNIQDDQSWVFSETVQKFSKITHAASRFSFLVRAVSVVKCLNEL